MEYYEERRRVIQYIEEHVHEEEIDLGEMERELAFSLPHIRDIFRKYEGIPLMKYIQKRKILNSVFDLMHSDSSVLDIALDYGFKNHETYTRAFGRIMHCPPKEIRKNRIGIGRFELIRGIYGINLISNGKERCYLDMRERYKDNESTILYGVKKVGYGVGGYTPYPSCLKSCANYLGEDVDYAYIMVLTGAAFRFTWNSTCWDMSNVDIFHTLDCSNDIYGLGAKALGRRFEFLERNENTTKEEFFQFIKEHIDAGYPCIALGIVGPPEAGIVTGYQENGKELLGWSFFQDENQWATKVEHNENGYYITDQWWENEDTQAVMCMGEILTDKTDITGILRNGIKILEGRKDADYCKGVLAYEAWRKMLADETEFQSAVGIEDKIICHDDAVGSLMDSRGSAAAYFKWLSEHETSDTEMYAQIAKAFQNTYDTICSLHNVYNNWGPTPENIELFLKKEVREEICSWIVKAEESDKKALELMKEIVK